ncbi:MAG: YibE/F family protein [Clostridia bacterium]|nr:YibE/F family protein [Clostridia bacterium]
MKDYLKKHQKSVVSYCGVALVLALVGLLWLTMGGSGKNKRASTAQSASGSDYYLPDVSDSDGVSADEMKIERVVVTKLLDISESGGDWGGESIVQRTQTFMVRILTGPYKGVEAEMQLDLTDITGTGKSVIIAKEGDRLLGYFVMDYDTYTLYGTCTGFQRDIPLMWLALGFLVLLLLFFGRNGIKSFSALIITCVMLILVMIPLVYHGMDPVLAVAIFGTATIVVTLLMVHGPSVSSLAAGMGAIGGVLTSALIAYILKNVIWITGTADEEAISLLYTDNGRNLDVASIMFAAIVIGSLGGTIDVSVSISSSLEELKDKMGKEITGWELARSGMSIGCDIMGASLNTMILAYVGSSFQLLMLFSAYNISFEEIINNEMIAVELLRALAGCFGLLMSVPITSVTAAFLSSRGNMGTFRLKDVKLIRVISGVGGRLSGAWSRALAEAKKKESMKREQEKPQVNLFEKARQHYDEMQDRENEKGE